MSRPVSLFCSGLPWRIPIDLLILLLDTWSSLSNIWPLSACPFDHCCVDVHPQLFYRVYACGVFFVSCPQAFAHFPNVHILSHLSLLLLQIISIVIFNPQDGHAIHHILVVMGGEADRCTLLHRDRLINSVQAVYHRNLAHTCIAYL